MAAAVKDTVNSLLEKLNLTSRDGGVPPKEPSDEELKELREKYAKADQEHVFAFYDELSTTEKGGLYERLSIIDPEYINQITRSALNPPRSSDEEGKANLEPLPESATASILDSKQEEIESWYSLGLDLVVKGQVAVVLMAGGQGTRLGSSAPKGCFDIQLPSHKSLFQIQAERIWKVQKLAEEKSGKKNIVVPWYVMTSGPTRGPTEQFFQEHDFFGLGKDDVVIFEQGVLPCISNEGKILLETKSKVAVAPDGNGGIYQALLTSNVRTDMRKRGIQHIHAYCVDNCLVKVADPVFLGFAASKDVDIATKVVRKRGAKESVGLILLKNGKPDVVEYSEIDSDTAEAKDPRQPDILKFRAANIVNHYYSFRFLETIEEWVHKLPHHVARKKIPYVDVDNGQTVKPEKPNGIKLEQFVFDVFPLLELNKFACMEVKREDEFSPLKNAKGTGEDDQDTSKKDILDQGKRWVQSSGGLVVSENGPDTAGVEISPLVSYGGEGLAFLKGTTIKAPAVVEKED
ncbi:UDP-N-acetylglucosamine pyrophosphorylase [Lobaria immixta]|nr:UDP-N-acetylglucosamine pyrophosphorylase [Lobaria immixta]